MNFLADTITFYFVGESENGNDTASNGDSKTESSPTKKIKVEKNTDSETKVNLFHPDFNGVAVRSLLYIII